MSIASWREEMRSAYLYRILAEVEQGTPRAGLFRELAGEAEMQAQIWASKALTESGETPNDYRPDLRSRIVGRLLRYFGPRPLLAVLSAMKVRGMSVYAKPDPAGHAFPINIAELGRRHQGIGRAGNLRAAVFG